MQLRGAALASVFALLGPSAANADLAEIRARGTLRVLAAPGSPAFYGVKPGNKPGLEREIIDGFARIHKLNVETVEVSWDEMIGALVTGRGDIAASGVTDTSARRQKIDFTAEVFPTRHVVVTRRPHRVVRTIEELREERVGVIKGTSLEEAAREAGVPAANLDASVPADGIADVLRSGQVTAVVDGIEDALLLQRADPALQIGTYVGAAGSLAFGVRKSDPHLRHALDEHLANVRRSQAWSRLVVDYFGPLALDVLKQARTK